MTLVDQHLHGRRHLAGGVQRGFEKEHIELHAEGFQVEILFVAQAGDRKMPDVVECIDIAGCAVGNVIRAHGFACKKGACDIGDVVAAITVFRPVCVFRRNALAACLHRAREVVDLVAGIVVIEFASDIPAIGVEHARQAVADRRAATVADVQWPGRIGGNEFDLHFLHCAVVVAAVLRTELVNARNLACIGIFRQEQVDETGPGDIAARDQFVFRQMPEQDFGNLARFAACRFRQHHRQVRSEVAMRAIAGAFELQVHARRVTVEQFRCGILECLLQ